MRLPRTISLDSSYRLEYLYAFGRLEPFILDGDPSVFIEDVINPRDALFALHSLRTMVDLVNSIVVKISGVWAISLEHFVNLLSGVVKQFSEQKITGHLYLNSRSCRTLVTRLLFTRYRWWRFEGARHEVGQGTAQQPCELLSLRWLRSIMPVRSKAAFHLIGLVKALVKMSAAISSVLQY